MRRIWKYNLEITDVQTLLLPEGAKILSCAEQYGRLALWVEIPDDGDTVKKEDRTLLIFGTGNPVSEDEKIFIGTVVLMGGDFVAHVYEKV